MMIISAEKSKEIRQEARKLVKVAWEIDKGARKFGNWHVNQKCGPKTLQSGL
jgi:hypothetical protein